MTVSPTGTYTDVVFPASPARTSFEWTFVPELDPTPHGYFWTNQFSFAGGWGGYAGLQTLGSGLPGKCVVFSISHAVAAASGDVPVGANGVLVNNFDGGPGYSTRYTFAWTPGTEYRFRVYKEVLDGTGQWWRCTITNLSTGHTTFVSRIAVPSGWGNLNAQTTAFSERYGGPPYVTCNDLGHSSVVFKDYRANSGAVPPLTVSSHFYDPVTCPNSRITGLWNGARQEMGIVGYTGSENITFGGSTLPSSSGEWRVPVEIALVNSDGTTGMVLDEKVDASIQVQSMKEWTVSWKMPAYVADPESGDMVASTQAPGVTKLKKVRVSLQMPDRDRVILFDAIVRRRKRTIISSNDEAGKVWEFTAYEVGYDWASRRCRIYPPGGIYETGGTPQNRIGQEPFGPTRTFGWPDPTCTQFVDFGTAAVQLWQQGNVLPFPNGRSGAPFGWLDNDAWWIWDRALAAGPAYNHPVGDIYGHKTFTMATAGKVVIDSAGDDAYELWLNDELLIARSPDAKANSTVAAQQSGQVILNWSRLARTIVTLGPGVHTLRFKCTNDSSLAGVPPGGGPSDVGGFICSVYNKNNGAVLARTDSSWLILGYPTDIGQTPGEIAGQVIVEARDVRGFDVPEVTFSPTLDSRFLPQPRIAKLPINVGATVQELLDKMAEGYIEYHWISDYGNGGYALGLFMAEGVELPGYGPAPSLAVEYADGTLREGAGGNCLELTYDEDATTLANVMLYLWDRGFAEIGPGDDTPIDIFDSIDAYGRHEAFLAIGDQKDAYVADRIASTSLRETLLPRPTVTATCSDGVGRFRADIPMLDYPILGVGGGRSVRVPNIDDPPIVVGNDDGTDTVIHAGTLEYMRFLGLTITEDSSMGTVRLVPSFNTRTELTIERIIRWLSRYNTGALNGRNAAASPDSPSIESTTIVEPQVQTFSGDVATVGAVGTPFTPPTGDTLVATQVLARSVTAGGGNTLIKTTRDDIVDSPIRSVTLPTGSKQGFAQWNGSLKLIVTYNQTFNVIVDTDGGHEHISVDVFFSPYPFDTF